MQFEFEFPDPKSNHNMEDFMDKMDNNSIDWQNFKAIQNNDHSNEKSAISDIFDKSKSNSRGNEHSFELNNSKDILQISYINPRDESQRSFRFQNEVEQEDRMNSSRYERIQKLLAKAKQNNLDVFYRNLDQENKAPKQASQFSSKQEFRKHINDLKESKKRDEDSFSRKKKRQQQYEKPMLKQTKKTSQSVPMDFLRKPSNQNYFLPEDFVEDDGKDFDEVNFQEFKLQPREYDSARQARQFFSQDSPRKRKQKRQVKKMVNLDTIRQEKATLFQKTLQQQKLNMLINNYKDMRGNFQQLMSELKDTNQGQSRIVDQLMKIKEQQKNMDKRQLFQQKKIDKQRALEAKQQQFQSIKDQINRIKQDNKDLLFMKINEKIQTLEGAVKSALEQIAEEKELPFTPKIINYFCEGDNREHSRQLSQAVFSEESMIERARNDSRHQMPIIISRAGKSMEINRQNFISPFDVAMEESAMNEFNQQMQDIFNPPEFAKPYHPKLLDTSNKNLRRSLTQKSSLVFESFQFHVSAKFSLIDNEMTPLVSEVRVSNKCMIDLADVFVIVYGNQGTDIVVRPTKIFRNILQPGASFDFEVYLNKQCLEDNGFYIQIAYKTNIVSKKKVNTKIPIPIIQLIRPQFIYEEQFVQAWNLLRNQIYIAPKTLDFMHIRSHEDLKLVLPFTHISESNPNVFSYGIMFRYPKTDALFLMKLECFINGKASVHLRTDRHGDNKIKEEIMDAINFLIFSQ